MKLAFSTLGCPGWDLDTILSKAKAYGFEGVDFRGLGAEMTVPKAPEFSSSLEDTLAKIGESGLSIAGLSSSVQAVPKDKQSFQSSLEELKLYLELAEKMAVPFVRIFGGPGPDGKSLEDRIKMGAQILAAMGDLAGEKSVQLVIETHDAWSSSQDVRRLVKAADHPCVGVCWDIQHPWAQSHESPQETWATLFPLVLYVHLKDAKILPSGEHALCLVGEGDVPVKECLQVMKDGRYAGYHVLEWEKRWHPELADPDVAFPAFVSQMKSWAAEIGIP